MRFVDAFRDPEAIGRARDEIRRLADPKRHYRITEVPPGTATHRARCPHHRGGASTAAVMLAGEHRLGTVVLSGGAFQNRLLLGAMRATLAAAGLHVWCNCAVPPNDDGISLGQAAIVAEMLGGGG